ncbi:DUF2929 family protein [Xylocopilactobacillus apicola]|uniref:DUF2929 domain-containing protein n=1 Tax=Xylocopilactobacillus apicola TaxID=2932184 RepID=A0AAU9DTG0_9LACO|nr:DUF2929 family protein [Xylocopilactobacillus apicola]BDR58673.1 hypothetical protein XA3_11140 [Xylocopilactobacillus apicola]
MKHLTSMVWIVAFFQILGFIGSSLTKSVYNPLQVLVISLIFGVIFTIVPTELEKLTKKN